MQTEPIFVFVHNMYVVCLLIVLVHGTTIYIYAYYVISQTLSH